MESDLPVGSQEAARGPLVEVSACAMKHPPQQMRDTDDKRKLEIWIHGS